ncbi:glycosyltransferase [Candidatus Woesearchaeota archaeon]|nr:glycosyltransferase [Candidatus Woesearchaeota archaeon]
MLQHVLWGISFITLWLTIIWLHYLFANEPETKELTENPKITLAIPAYNEEKTILKTINSIIEADYPIDKKEIIIVNDGSTDKTAQVVEAIIKKNQSHNIILLQHAKNSGNKSIAVNTALDNATGEYFSVLDADSRISKNGIKLLLPYFYNQKVGAVISRVKVETPNKILEKIQFFEYIMSNMIRKLMSLLGTLHITPGVLSTYKTETLRKIGGFTRDRNNLTEDMEIALRLIQNGYKIEMQPESITYTFVPKGIKTLWRQRLRWARGYIYNMWSYRKMMFSPKHGIFGIFQMPVNVIIVITLIVNITIILINLIDTTTEFLFRSATITGYFWKTVTAIPTVTDVMLGQNYRILVPLAIVTILGFYLIWQSHRRFNERITNNITGALAYFIFIPYFTTMNWIASIFQEVFKTKRKW